MWVPKRRQRALGAANTRHGRLRREYCARLEVLEDRQLLAGFTVNDNSQADQMNPGTGSADSMDGQGLITLWSAIEAADFLAQSAPVTINFDLPAGMNTISPVSQDGSWLSPLITVPLTINGTGVVLDGTNAEDNTALDFANTGNNTVQGLTIQNWPTGISLAPSISGPNTSTSTGNVITDCTMSAAGLTMNNCVANTIGGTSAGAGNILVGTQSAGADSGAISIIGGNTNVVEGNDVGVTPDGNPDANTSGISIDGSSQNTIGGTVTGASNALSGNTCDGIYLYQDLLEPQNESSNVIQGNYIGTNPTNGALAIPNGMSGIEISGAVQTMISGNVISGNTDDGITIDASDTINNFGNNPPSFTTIQYNYIGVTSGATAALPNGGNGISIGVPDFTVTNNYIGGNTVNGIEVDVGSTETNSNNNTIAGNIIGLSKFATPLYNQGNGIEVDSSSHILIGGTTPSAGNLIWRSRGFGVDIEGPSGSSNSIINNDIAHNDKGGIYLGTGTNIMPGTNLTILPPTFTDVDDASGGYSISGTLADAPGTYIIQYFAAPADGGTDAARSYEGENLVTNATVTIPPGASQINLSLAFTPPASSYLSATVTDSAGNTSEFSPGDIYTGINPNPPPAPQAPTLQLTVNPTTPTSVQPVTFTLAVSGPAGTPSGTVTFSVDGAGQSAPMPLNAAGIASSGPRAPLDAGMRTITATFTSDDPNYDSGSISQQVTVVGPPLLVVTPASKTPSVLDQDLITATVTAPAGATTPLTGTIVFTLAPVVPTAMRYVTTVPLGTTGMAQVNLFGAAAGSYTLIVTYTGNYPIPDPYTAPVTVAKANVSVDLVAQQLEPGRGLLNITLSCHITDSLIPAVTPVLGMGLVPFNGSIGLVFKKNVTPKSQLLQINDKNLRSPVTISVDYTLLRPGADTLTTSLFTGSNFTGPAPLKTHTVEFLKLAPEVSSIVALPPAVTGGPFDKIDVYFNQPMQRSSLLFPGKVKIGTQEFGGYYTVQGGKYVLTNFDIPSSNEVELTLNPIHGPFAIYVIGEFRSVNGTKKALNTGQGFDFP